jgi:hypothetical protein
LKHISPYRDDINNFVEIPPKPFHSANKVKFSAVGMGEMMIDVPNSADISQLQLMEVLYSPEVGYTLVFIGQLDEKDFSATFSGRKCILTRPDGSRVGMVPTNCHGLYHVEHEPESANAAIKVVMLYQLHRHLGHVLPVVAQKLVEDGFVTGVRLESTPEGSEFFCESCVYAKATRKPVSKAQQGTQAENFGDEIHSDVWGPAPVATKSWKHISPSLMM